MRITEVKRDLKRRASRLVQIVERPRLSSGIRCLVYHSIVKERHEDRGQMTTPVSLFSEHMAFLKAGGYRVEDAASAIERMLRGDPMPPNTVVLTFDDGLLDNYELALPILSRYQFPATFFLIVEALDGQVNRLHNAYPGPYMRWAHLQELRASGLGQVGCHSATHRDLPGLPRPLLEEEVPSAKQRLEEQWGQPVRLFAYPFGSFSAWDETVRACVEAAGFLAAFTSIAGFNTRSTDPFLFRRCRVSWCDELPEFERLLQGAYDWYAAVQWLQAFSARRRRVVQVGSGHGRH